MVEVKYPVLKPKESITEKMAMSKIHVSRNWKLPPLRARDKYRKGGDNGDSPGTASDGSSPDGVDYTTASKKKKQNREAQRAYRERSKNRLQALEENVEALQGIVRAWQTKYNKLSKEYDSYKHESTKRIAELETAVEENKDDRRCFICMKNVGMDDIKQNARDTDLKPLFADDFLNQAIENFKPIPAVSIKTPTKTTAPPSKRQRKKISAIILKSQSSSPPQSHSPEARPQPFSNTMLDDGTLDVEKGDCGFCHDNTTCVCRDIKESNSGTHQQDKKLSSTGNGLLLDTLLQPVDNGKTKYTESAMRSTHCSENPSNCEKCLDIDKSCIKPIQDDLLTKSPKRGRDVMDDLPMEYEIDLNKFLPPSKKQKKK